MFTRMVEPVSCVIPICVSKRNVGSWYVKFSNAQFRHLVCFKTEVFVAVRPFRLRSVIDGCRSNDSMSSPFCSRRSFDRRVSFSDSGTPLIPWPYAGTSSPWCTPSSNTRCSETKFTSLVFRVQLWPISKSLPIFRLFRYFGRHSTPPVRNL